MYAVSMSSSLTMILAVAAPFLALPAGGEHVAAPVTAVGDERSTAAGGGAEGVHGLSPALTTAADRLRGLAAERRPAVVVWPSEGEGCGEHF